MGVIVGFSGSIQGHLFFKDIASIIFPVFLPNASTKINAIYQPLSCHLSSKLLQEHRAKISWMLVIPQVDRTL